MLLVVRENNCTIDVRSLVASQSQEIAQLQNVNDTQRGELKNLVNLVIDTDEINLNLAKMSEQFMKIKNWVQEMKINESIT
jgi:hypothetical protein